MIRVLIAEPHAIVRHRLAQLCHDTHDVTVAGLVAGPEVLPAVQSIRPNVVIMSLGLQPHLTFEALREIKRNHTDTPVILLSLYHHDSYAVCALEAGASGYLMMEHAQEQLIETVRMFVIGGSPAMDPEGQFAAI